MTDKTIEHIGNVVEKNGGHAVVKIRQTSACVSCSARKFCRSNENREKMIDVFGLDENCVKVGDEVTVCATVSTGWNALLYAFILPLVILMAVLIAVLKITGDEVTACLAGITALVPYYIVLWALKDKMRKKFVFWIKK